MRRGARSRPRMGFLVSAALADKVVTHVGGNSAGSYLSDVDTVVGRPGRSGSFDAPAPARPLCKFDAVSGAGLPQDVGHVAADRLVADEQASGDLCVCLTGQQAVENLPLPRGERWTRVQCQRGPRRGWLVSRRRRKHDVGLCGQVVDAVREGRGSEVDGDAPCGDEGRCRSGPVVPAGEQVMSQTVEGAGMVVLQAGLLRGGAGRLPELVQCCSSAAALGTLRCMERTEGGVDDVARAQWSERRRVVTPSGLDELEQVECGLSLGDCSRGGRRAAQRPGTRA